MPKQIWNKLFFLGLFLYAQPSIALEQTCEQILQKAGINFEMQDEHTVVLSQNKGEPVFLLNLNAPKCDILFPDGWLITEGNTKLNSINTRFLQNYGSLKAKKITLAPRNENLTLGNKGGATDTGGKSSQRNQTPFPCGLINGHSGTELNQIEVTYIDVQCPNDVALMNSGGSIKATEIRAQSYSPQMLKEGWGSTGIWNMSLKEDGGKAVITADVIKGRGYGTGIYNAPDSTIYARTIEGFGIESSSDDDPKNLFHGNGIENFGIIKAKEAKCCPAQNGTCYIHDGVQIDKKFPIGKISTEVKNSCSK